MRQQLNSTSETPMLDPSSHDNMDDNRDGSGTINYSRWRTSSENIQMEVNQNKPSGFLKSLGCKKRTVVIVLIVVVVFLIVGFISGYLVRRSYHLGDVQNVGTTCITTEYQKYTKTAFESVAKLIDINKIHDYIRSDTGKYYPAGSGSGHSVSKELISNHCSEILKFVRYFEVLLSRPVGSNIIFSVDNQVVYKTDKSAPEPLKPFVAYTHSGYVTGPPVYASFGRQSDFLEEISYSEAICFIRYGKINPYNKILNAHKAGCIGVVLYPDPKEFPHLTSTDMLITNAKMADGDPLTPGVASVGVYKLSINETKDILPPDLPVFSASQDIVKKALKDGSATSDITLPEDWLGNLDEKYYHANVSKVHTVFLNSTNKLENGKISQGICAIRGEIDSDKFLLVGTHHDQAGSGVVNPTTGHAIMREMIRLLSNNLELYKPRRSIIFVTEDASYLGVGTKEWIEANFKEFNDRTVGYLALTGTLNQGSKLVVRAAPPLQKFVQSVLTNHKLNEVSTKSFEGTNYYKPYIADLGVPTLEMSFTDRETSSGLDTLPVCCKASSVQTNESLIKLAAQIHLDVIMRLVGQPILPYNITEIGKLIKNGTDFVKNSGIRKNLLKKLEKKSSMVQNQLAYLDTSITEAVNHNIKDVNLRRINDALTGLTRSFISSEGVPMIDPKDSKKVIRNPNNRNMLVGSTSNNDYEVVTFPGLRELLLAPEQTNEIQRQIEEHAAEIYVSMNVVINYCNRAIKESNTFKPI